MSMTQDVGQVQGYEMTVDYGWKRSSEENIQTISMAIWLTMSLIKYQFVVRTFDFKLWLPVVL